MRIAISVVREILKPQGGAVRAKSVFDILKGRHDATLIARGNQELKQENLIVVKAPLKGSWNLRLLPIIIRNKFDCIYCCGDMWGFLTYYALSKLFRYKIVFEAHGIQSEERKLYTSSKGKIKQDQIIEKFVIQHADYVIALSEDILTFYQEYNRNISLIPLCVDIQIFKSNGVTRKRKNKRGYRQIGLIGPFYPGFNTDAVEFLYSNLSKFDERLRFVVIGRCDNRIKDERVSYTGYLPSIEDYARQLRCLDAVLNCEIEVGPYTKVLEAMACGLPVFTTPRARQGMEWVRDGEDIIMCQPEEIVEVINRSLFDEGLMQRIGQNARTGVKKHHSIEAVAKKLEEVLTRVVSSSGTDEH